jgi:hypothetical protein
VLVNGEQPTRCQGLVVGDAIITDERMSYYGRSKHKVVMGGVPYPIDDETARLISSNSISNAVVFFIPMGAVDFVPSREELHFTPRTKDYLRKMVSDFAVAARNQAQDEINAATTKPQALTAAARWRRIGNFEAGSQNPFRFRGEIIPNSFSGANFWYDPNAYGTRKTSRCSSVTAEKLDQAVFIHGYEAEGSPSATVRERVAQWQANNGHSPRKYLCFASTNFVGEWTNALTVDYATIKATKLPKVSAAKSGSYTYVKSYDWDTVDANGALVPVNGSKITGKVAYYSPTDLVTEYNRTDSRQHLYVFLSSHGYTLVEVAKNSQNRMVSEVAAKCEPLVDVMASVTAKLYGTLSDRTIAIAEASLPHRYLTQFHGAYGSQINHANLRAELADALSCYNDTERVRSSIAAAYRRVQWSAPNHREINHTVCALSYPLIGKVLNAGGYHNDGDQQDLVVYANAKWQKLTDLS